MLSSRFIDYPEQQDAAQVVKGWAPSWLLRWRLTAANRTIAQIERLLDEEFGLVETEPLHQDLYLARAIQADTQRRLAMRLN